MDNKNKNKTQGKFWIENVLIDNYLNKISGNELKVWCVLSRHFNKEGNCYPSIRTISKKTGIHHETTKRCLQKLELLGFLEQLIIKERCKLRYSFSKTALFLMPGNKKLLVNSDTKEDIKEELKENNNLYITQRTPEEQKRINAQLDILRKRWGSQKK